VIGSQGQDEPTTGSHVLGQGREVPVPLTEVGTHGDRLLGLVHHQRVATTRLQPDK